LSRRNRKERKKREALEAERGPSQGADIARKLASRADALARTRWFLPAALAVLTLGVWARTFAVPVVNWDDDTYIYRDARLARLSPTNIGRILAEPYFANYHPVTTLTYAFDRAAYGRWTPGFHATQLAFYLAGVILLYHIFRAVLGGRWAAFAGAAIYSVHAIHVEAVAWLAQRKDVVCLAFYAGAILAYVRYAKARAKGEGRQWRPYAAAVACGALAMLSKGYAVVLPGVLIAYDLCFDRRRREEPLWGVGWRRVWDKLPFVALALAVTAFTILSQGKDSALTGESLGFRLRVTALCQCGTVAPARSPLREVRAGDRNRERWSRGPGPAPGACARRRVPAASKKAARRGVRHRALRPPVGHRDEHVLDPLHLAGGQIPLLPDNRLLARPRGGRGGALAGEGPRGQDARRRRFGRLGVRSSLCGPRDSAHRRLD